MLVFFISIFLNLFSTNQLVLSTAPSKIVILDRFLFEPKLTVVANIFRNENSIRVSYDYYYYDEIKDLTYTLFARVDTEISEKQEVFIRVAINYIYSFDSNFEVFKSEEVCREPIIPFVFDKLDSASVNKKILNKYALSLLDLINTYKYKDSKYFKKLLQKTETLGSLFAELELAEKSKSF